MSKTLGRVISNIWARLGKQVVGKLYFQWQPFLRRGMLIIATDKNGVEHGAMFFGVGMRAQLDTIYNSAIRKKNSILANRILSHLQNPCMTDTTPFVLEVQCGILIATEMLSFLGNNDRVRVYQLNHDVLDRGDELFFMAKAATMVLPEIGDTEREGFEVITLGYLRSMPNVNFPRSTAKGTSTYQATSITGSKDFTLILDSDSH